MKKFIICVCILVAALFCGLYAYFYLGVYIRFGDKPVTAFMTADEDTIYMERDGQAVPFEIRGVDLGSGMPGEYATDFAIDQDTYLRWFGLIQELGANTVRVYTIQSDDFYRAFYDYNTGRTAAGEEPLWLLHGVWVDDYSQFSHKDAFDDDILGELVEDGKIVVDILHGRRIHLGRDGDGSGYYLKDVSQWVLGYILGVEWRADLVTYTNQNHPDMEPYQGQYLRAAPEASPFESMLAQLGDAVIAYETHRYGEQRLVSFANGTATDPFCYSMVTTSYRYKTAAVNVEHIQPTEEFRSGYFASYNVYPYYPNYLETELEARQYTRDELFEIFGDNQVTTVEHRIALMDAPSIYDYLIEADLNDSSGRQNTYYTYFKALNNFHDIPVVIAEYGVSSGRGVSQLDGSTGRNQGGMTEQEQGEALISCYKDIMDAGCAGSCLFSWQDEWFKRSWNTMYAVDFDRSVYWSDYQTNDQFFGLLTFDPGETESVCYVDGDPSEWSDEDIVWSGDAGTVSMKYDEKFLYFYVDADAGGSAVYLPIDTTPKSGSIYCANYGISFDRGVDFVVCIDGARNSRVVVQERYEALKSTYWESYYVGDPYLNPPDTDSPTFVTIQMPTVLRGSVTRWEEGVTTGESIETGRLRLGNANPASDEFDSLADFCYTADGGVELRLPWQLLNFADPSRMRIHDDYYENYGIEYIRIDELYVGLALDGEAGPVPMSPLALEGWGNDISCHERLKESYYMLQAHWAENGFSGREVTGADGR